MKTIQEIKELYPTIDINTEGGSDSFQEGVDIVERDPIAVIIKHPTEELFLLADWKNSDWKGFLTGGIEDGDSVETTVRKEILEETGYTHVSKIVAMDCVSHGLFFHTVKKVNRLAHYHLVFAELADLDKKDVSDEEKSIAEFIWVKKEDVLHTLSRKDMKILWEYYIAQPTS